MEPSSPFLNPARLVAALAFAIVLAGFTASARAESPTFHADIAPLIHENCASCHRPGGAGPFSLLTYADAQKHAEAIAEAVESRAMPLWKPERGYGAFRGERRLETAEIKRIRQWVEGGSAEGDAAKGPEPPAVSDGWRHGEPDLVLTLDQPVEFKAKGGDVFRNFSLPLNLKEPKSLRAVEFQFDDSEAVRSASLLVDRSGFARQLDEIDAVPGFGGIAGGAEPGGFLAGWSHAKTVSDAGEGLAWTINPGNSLVLQLHLLPGEKPGKLQPKIGLYFSEDEDTRTITSIRIGSAAIDIPAGKENYLISETFILPVDAEMESVFPLAHSLCREIELYALLPNGSHRPLLRIPDWDPGWLEAYRFLDPVRLPAGTKIRAEFRYDNTAENDRNPNVPPKRVVWGPEAGDERADLWLRMAAVSEDGAVALSSAAFQAGLKLQIDGHIRVLENAPDDFEANSRIGHILVSQNRMEQAIPFLERALKAHPESWGVLHNLGVAHAGIGSAEAAVESFQKVIALNAAYAPSINGLASALALGGKLEEAIPHFRRYLEIVPDAGEVRLNLGVILTNLKRVEEAEAEFRTAIERAPGYAQAHARLAELLGRLGRVQEAQASFGAAVGLAPEDISIRIAFAQLLFSLEKFDQARTHLDKVIQLEPDHAGAKEGLKQIEAATAAAKPGAEKAE